jgi:hypothetical protein
MKKDIVKESNLKQLSSEPEGQEQESDEKQEQTLKGWYPAEIAVLGLRNNLRHIEHS